MQLTQFTDYGLRSLMYLASQEGRLCSVREISEHYNISRNHLVKIIHHLAQIGYITSTKGKGGGIRLSHNPNEILIGDIVSALEPNMDLVECFNSKDNTCTIVIACRLKHFLADAKKSFIHSLNQHTLSDAISDKKLLLDLKHQAS